MSKEVFISYSWSEKDIADKIYNDLSIVGLKIHKDDKSIHYTDSIREFMNTIKKTDFAILLISENYLKSVNCMYEILQLIKSDENYWDKVLPILCNIKIFSIEDRIEYMKFWESKYSKLKETLSTLDAVNSISIIEEVKVIKEISENISTLLSKIKESLCLKPQDLFNEYYKQIFKRIDIEPDVSKLIELIPISNTENPKKRLKLINAFIKKYNIENASCYSIVASCHRDLKNKELAVQYYKKAIEIDNFNYGFWNNLGRVYEGMYKNFDEAEKAYLESLNCNPTSDIPRLNLAVLYKNHFKDFKKAKEINESILKFDENNSKAHNNLATIYRSDEFRDFDKFEKHIKIAMEQDLIDAYINYANYLKTQKKEIELGNSYYLKAKELDKKGYYKEIIDILINSNKG